jgi:hypothetical protein
MARERSSIRIMAERKAAPAPFNGWIRRNVAWLVTTIFLAGGLVATWSLHLRASDIHVSVADRERLVRIEEKLDALQQRMARVEEKLDAHDGGAGQ